MNGAGVVAVPLRLAGVCGDIVGEEGVGEVVEEEDEEAKGVGVFKLGGGKEGEMLVLLVMLLLV